VEVTDWGEGEGEGKVGLGHGTRGSAEGHVGEVIYWKESLILSENKAISLISATNSTINLKNLHICKGLYQKLRLLYRASGHFKATNSVKVICKSLVLRSIKGN
jgi:hypothetical protein